jgi:sugar phosphate isomerase/epimerase
MQTIKGPAIFLAQFLADEPPFNTIKSIALWAASLGYKGVQVPSWDSRLIDLNTAAQSKTYCEDYLAQIEDQGLELVELAAYIQGQAMGISPAYELLFQHFFPKKLSDRERMLWASTQLKNTILAAEKMGTTNVSVLSGGLAWPYMYPWPVRSQGLIKAAFEEMVRRWLPVLNFAAEHGITIGFELHPGSDLFDGATYLRFLEMTNQHPAACLTFDASHFLLQQLDYIAFIKIFHARIKAFHVKDAEFRPTGLMGVYGGYEEWKNRPGRFRSPGDGQVDFKQIFTALTEYGFDGWAIMEWECCIKSEQQGAVEGAEFIRRHIIDATQKNFDDFVKNDAAADFNKQILGIV